MSVIPPALPSPYTGPAPSLGPEATPELGRLVDAQVAALVAAAPAAADMNSGERDALAEGIGKVAKYVAALALMDWQLSDEIGQRPLVRTVETLRPEEDPTSARHGTTSGAPLARTQANFQSRAADRVGAVTRSTLRAISFPSFVADLIKGVFNAILDATQTQMGAFTEMLDAVAKTVDQFETENISNAEAEQWLVQRYPRHLRMESGSDGPRAVPTDADEPPAGIRNTLNLPDDVDVIDDVTLEEILIPAARRKLAQSRMQMLSTMVMMGLQRIVINHGRIRATMGFHIDATDTAHEERADMLDTRIGVQGQVGFGWWSASARTSVTYVRSTKADSDAELNVNADLTGEVDLTFSTDYMPLNRMATTEKIERIRANTPNPAENAPSAAAAAGGAAAPAGQSAAQMVAGRFTDRQDQLPTLPSLTTAGQRATQPMPTRSRGAGTGATGNAGTGGTTSPRTGGPGAPAAQRAAGSRDAPGSPTTSPAATPAPQPVGAAP